MKKIVPTLLVLGLVPILPTHAAIVVNYNNALDVHDAGDDLFNDPSSATLVVSDLDGDTVADDVTGFADNHTFSTTTAFDGASTPGYIGPDIFGAIRAQRLNSTSVPFSDKDLADFNVRLQPALGFEARMHMAIFFKTAASTTLDSSSWLGFSTSSAGTTDGLARTESLTLRFMLWTGSSFYLSNTLVSDTVGGRVLDGTELATEMWALYDPATEMNFNSAVFNVSTATINADGIDGYGFYSENDTFTGNRQWMTFSIFQADAIPEPSAMALFAAGLAGLLFSRRRI